MGIARVALSWIATTIALRWWEMMACLKAHDSVRQFGWSAADWAANDVVQIAALVGAIKSASRFDSANES